jgi:ABC-type transport system involved in multi-copper enzyme maturation permease subunit
MFTLIKREIEDHKIHFVMAFVMSIIFSIPIIAQLYRPENKDILPLLFPVLTILTIIGICSLGASQMNIDKTRKISAFLLTLPVTRSQIFAARVLTGIFALLVLLIPPAVTLNIALGRLWQGQATYKYFTAEIFSSLFLTCLGIYCTALLCGLSKSRLAATPTLIGLFLGVFLLTLIVVKGFGIEASVILFFYVVSSLTFSWFKFNSAAFI